MSDEIVSKTEEIDFKATKTTYPRINNDNVLEFIFERDPNLYLRKNKVLNRFKLYNLKMLDIYPWYYCS